MAGKILGLGTDIIEIGRIRESIAKHGNHFLNRLFSVKEQEYCQRHKDYAPSFAARFAAKEAIAKALGCGFGEKLSWLDLEIINNDLGQPSVLCSEEINKRFDSPQFLVSMSHSVEYATAVAIYLSYTGEKGS